MREIKFRGVTPTKCWITGSLIYHGEQPRIEFVTRRHPADNRVLDTDWAYVDPKTVGQFTGLLDKNGKEIYEGDILSNSRQFSEIVFDEEKAAFKVKIIGGSKGWIKGSVIDIHLFQSDYDINIIGNIHDNPELLKKEEK